MKICFLLGVQRRSGTNYLFRLLEKHPECTGPGPIWEDYLLHFSDMLSAYTGSLFHKWNDEWRIAEKVESESSLTNRLGDVLRALLHKQVKGPQKQFLLAKTPSVRNIENFFELFPDDYLVVIVRDGRSVVESGVRSFDQDYEGATRRWVSGARAIRRAQEKFSGNENFRVVRYEDIFTNTKSELIGLCRFLGLDEQMYPFEEAGNLPLYGSSELRKTQVDDVHWRPVDKPSDFSPLNRYQNWSREQHQRFNWLAGELMEEFGYELEHSNEESFVYSWHNKLLDYKYLTEQRLKKMRRILGVADRK